MPYKISWLYAAIAIVVGWVSPSRADDWKAIGYFGWSGVGKVYQIEKGHIYWVGDFSGSFASDKGPGSPLDQTGWKCPGFNDLDFNNKKSKAAGHCIVTDPASGDQLYSVWQCEGDTTACHGTNDYTGGTGRFQGVTGGNTFVGHTQVNWPDGSASGYSTINR
jgi:hypothetical protein